MTLALVATGSVMLVTFSLMVWSIALSIYDLVRLRRAK